MDCQGACVPHIFSHSSDVAMLGFPAKHANCLRRDHTILRLDSNTFFLGLHLVSGRMTHVTYDPCLKYSVKKENAGVGEYADQDREHSSRWNHVFVCHCFKQLSRGCSPHSTPKQTLDRGGPVSSLLTHKHPTVRIDAPRSYARVRHVIGIREMRFASHDAGLLPFSVAPVPARTRF